MATPRDYTVHLIGHGHIDPTWRWRWTEGYEEVRATFTSALQRLNEYDGVTFTASSACFYAWLRDSDPDLFEEVRLRVQEGRWEIAGGMWIEPDCNIPSGEAFIRQGIEGQRFFHEAFGKRAAVGFNPDSFGHAGTLPQILNQLGMPNYVFMRPMPESEMAMPDGATFWWLANDGSRVLTTALPESYNGTREEVTTRIAKITQWPHHIKDQRHLLCFYGVGNHGGGPTKRTIEGIIEQQSDESLPKLLFSRLDKFFEGIRASHLDSSLPTIDTDLQHHARGCYSVHSEVKRLNRRAEHEILAAERLSSIALEIHGRPYPSDALRGAWRDLLYNQFHDILAGTSLESSYEDTRGQLGRARFTAREQSNAVVQSIVGDIDTSSEGNTIVVFNTLPWEETLTVEAAPHVFTNLGDAVHVVDDAGRVMPSQIVAGPYPGSSGVVFQATVPALGYRCYAARRGDKRVRVRSTLECGIDYIENDWWRIALDGHTGQMASIFDKKNRVECVTGVGLAAFADHSDTWSHGEVGWRTELGRFQGGTVHIAEEGDVHARVLLRSCYSNSTAEQWITLYRESPNIDLRVCIDWREKHTVLKMLIYTPIRDGSVTCDTAYGSQHRNTSGSEEPCQMWVDLTGKISGKPHGVAIANDSKYSFDVHGSTIGMTLLRSPVYCHHDPDRVEGTHPYRSMDQGYQEANFRMLPHAGSWEDTPIVREAWSLNCPPIVHLESAHRGELPPANSFLECTNEQIVISVFKPADSGDGWIVRGYETAGREAKGQLRFPNRDWAVDVVFRPHEIKTLHVDFDEKVVTEVNALEDLPEKPAKED